MHWSLSLYYADEKSRIPLHVQSLIYLPMYALKPLKAIFFHGCCLLTSGNFPNCQALKEFCQEKIVGIPTSKKRLASSTTLQIAALLPRCRLVLKEGLEHGQKVKHYSSNPPSITRTLEYNITRLAFQRPTEKRVAYKIEKATKTK